MKFEKPELKLVRFDLKDVLTASGTEQPPITTDENELPPL